MDKTAIDKKAMRAEGLSPRQIRKWRRRMRSTPAPLPALPEPQMVTEHAGRVQFTKDTQMDEFHKGVKVCGHSIADVPRELFCKAVLCDTQFAFFDEPCPVPHEEPRGPGYVVTEVNQKTKSITLEGE